MLALCFIDDVRLLIFYNVANLLKYNLGQRTWIIIDKLIKYEMSQLTSVANS